MPKDRRHAAILFSDIVGYTKLMGSDEDRAFEVLSKNREIHQQLVEKFNGTIIKEIGDGMLISFNLASDAVYCAIEIQKKCKEQDIPLKVAVNEGELVYEGADVIGDVVNVASRMEADTQHGCITISGKVYSDIKNRKDIQTKFIKEKKFKNVDDPIKVYNVLCEEEATEQQSSIQDKGENPRSNNPYYIVAGIVIVAIIILFVWNSLPSKKTLDLEKSIAVLPLKYLSSDQSKQYLADGVMDAITGHLSKIDSLIVRPRTSVEQYRDTDKTMQIIGDELGVSYLIEGSFLMVDNQVKLTIQLINAKNEDHMFFEEYDRDYNDIMAVQSEVAQTIAKKIEVIITPEKRERIESLPTENLKAYDFYLKANSLWTNDTDSAINLYQEAIELDPQFALAYIGLGFLIHWNIFSTASSTSVYFDPSYGDTLVYFANKALSIDPELAEGYWLLGEYYFNTKGDFDLCIELYQKASELNPNSRYATSGLAESYYEKGDYKNTLIYNRKTLDLAIGTKSYFRGYGSLGRNSMSICDYSSAETALKEYSEHYPLNGFKWLSRLSASRGEWDNMRFYVDKVCAIDSGETCYKQLGDYNLYTGHLNDAKKHFEKYRTIVKDEGHLDDYIRSHYAYAFVLYQLNQKEEALELFNNFLEAAKECLRLGLICHVKGRTGIKYMMAGVYACTGKADQSYQLLHEMENDVFYGDFVWLIQVDPHFELLWEDEEFKQIIKRQEKKLADIRAELYQLEKEGKL